MANDVMETIRNAEAQAEKIRADAADKARAMNAEALKRSAEKYEAAAAAAEKDKHDTLDSILERADELIKKSASEAAADAAEIRRSADREMRDAVKLIFWEICEKCQ